MQHWRLVCRSSRAHTISMQWMHPVIGKCLLHSVCTYSLRCLRQRCLEHTESLRLHQIGTQTLPGRPCNHSAQPRPSCSGSCRRYTACLCLHLEDSTSPKGTRHMPLRHSQTDTCQQHSPSSCSDQWLLYMSLGCTRSAELHVPSKGSRQHSQCTPSTHSQAGTCQPYMECKRSAHHLR